MPDPRGGHYRKDFKDVINILEIKLVNNQV